MITTVRRCAWVAVLGACGRIDFDPLAPSDAAVGTGCTPGQADCSCTPPPRTNGALPGQPALALTMNTIDASGTRDVFGHLAACIDGCPTAVTDAGHHGLVFSGHEFLQVDWAQDLDASAGYTVGVWVRLDQIPTPPADACAIAEPNRAGLEGDSYSLCAYQVDNGIYDYTTSSNTQSARDSQGALGARASLPLREWHHLALTWDAATRAKTLYVDGCRASAADPVEISFDHGPLAIGADLENFPAAPSPLFFWTGALDDFMFYTRALDDAAIRLLAAPP